MSFFIQNYRKIDWRSIQISKALFNECVFFIQFHIFPICLLNSQHLLQRIFWIFNAKLNSMKNMRFLIWRRLRHVQKLIQHRDSMHKRSAQMKNQHLIVFDWYFCKIVMFIARKSQFDLIEKQWKGINVW